MWGCSDIDQDTVVTSKYPIEELILLDEKSLNHQEDIARQTRDSVYLVDVLMANVHTLRKEGNFQEALEVWEEIFRLEKFIEEDRLGNVYNELASLYYYAESHDQSILSYKKAIRYYDNQGQTEGVAKVLHNISAAYNDTKQYDSCYFYSRRSITYCAANGLDSLKHIYQSGFGIDFLENGQIDSARKYLSTILDNTSAGHDLAMALLNLGYFKERTGDLDTAFILYVRAGEEAESADDYDNHWKAINNQAYVSYFSGEYKRAFELMDSLIFLKKDRAQLELAERISGLEKKYQNLQQEKEIQELRFEMERTSLIRNTSLAIVVLALIVSGLIVNAVMSRMRQSRVRSDQRIAELQKEKELAGLQTMIVAQEEERKRIAMDLHDGIGVLLSAARLRLSRLSKTGETFAESSVVSETESIIENASQEIRKVSHQMMPGVLTKLGLFEGIEDLLESLEDDHGIKVKLHYPELDDRLSEKVEVMVYRIVQELINNTLKHSEAKNVLLSFKLVDRHMHMEFSDDGKGFNPDDASIQKSLGIQSIASRVKLLEGIHTITSMPGKGMNVAIDFDIAANENTPG